MDTIEPSDNACAGLGDADRALLEEAADILLDSRGTVIRISEWLGGRLHGLGRRFADIGPHLLGEDWQTRYQALVEGALRNAYRVGTLGLGVSPGAGSASCSPRRRAAPAASSAFRALRPTCRSPPA
jgi:hypothetical protein